MYLYLKKTARTIVDSLKVLPTYLHWTRKFKGDPLFKLSELDRGLLPRSTSPSRTEAQRTEVAERIIRAYRKASTDLIPQRPVYKVSNEWVPIFQKPLLPLLAALESGNAVELRKLLDDFFRNSISRGLIGLAADMEGKFFKKKPGRFLRMQLLIDSLYRYRLLKELLPATTPADLHIEDFGNPYGMFVEGKFLRTGVDYQYYYAKRIAEMLAPLGARTTVVELGGGIGGFAYFLNKARSSDLTYINLDLPEILCISAYQLLNLFPEKRTLLYGEIDRIDSATVSAFEIALLPSFVVESLADNSVDISFNSYSLAEMDLATIQNYAAHLSRVSKQAIFHVNHVADALVGADRFSFDAAKFELVSRTRALWNLGRSLQCDEYEFVFRRRNA